MILVLAARPADADEIRIPLPELLAAYVYDDTSPSSVWDLNDVHVQTDIPWSQVSSVTLVVAGSIDEGLVAGDGVVRPAEQAALLGAMSFGASYQLGPMTISGNSPERIGTSGAFTAQWPVWIPDENTECGLVYTNSPGGVIHCECDFPQFYELRLWALLTADLARSDLPGLYDPPEPFEIPTTLGGWAEGLEFIEPITAEISQAYLVIETAQIPEPTTGALLLGAGAMWLRRRKR